MKAARLHAYHQRLSLDEVDAPRVMSPSDVVVRIGGAGLCRTDLHILEGQWREKANVQLPYTLGHENAGWVHEIGSAVATVSVGDAVIVHPLITCGLCRECRSGNDMHCTASAFPGIDADGGFADFLRTSSRSVIKLDRRLQPHDVAALADAGLTAYHAVKKVSPILHPGCTAVVIGAGGGLGHIGIQSLAALTPAEVIAVDSSEEGLSLARQVGAHVTVLAENKSHVKQVLDLTNGRGAHAVFDFVGEGKAVEHGIAMLRRGGFYLVIGYGGRINLPTIDVISREINFIGNLVGTFNDLTELMTLATQARVKLQTKTYPLDAIGDAVADLDKGALHGRAILIPEAAHKAA